MRAPPCVRDPDADLKFQAAVCELFPQSHEFESHYVEHEISHIAHMFATGVCSVDGQEVLEFGCNIGATSIVLTHYGARVTAVDIEQAFLEVARLNTKRYGMEIRFEMVGEGHALPFPNDAFDVVVCNSVLEYVRPDLNLVQSELDRVLKPGGMLLVFGTSNRLWPVEAHSREWFNNYVPKGFDAISGRQRERGVWPLELRHGFGPHYDDLFSGSTGARRYIELKQMMGLKGWRVQLLNMLGVCFAISPLSLPLFFPFATALLKKLPDDDSD